MSSWFEFNVELFLNKLYLFLETDLLMRSSIIWVIPSEGTFVFFAVDTTLELTDV